ncbi:hypothetical protein D3C81_1303580 [compost metagenome]
MVFLGVTQLRDQDVAAHVIPLRFAQLHTGGQIGAHLVFHLKILLQHLHHRHARLETVRTHVRVAAQEQDATQQRIGVLGLLLHFVANALVQRMQALILVATGMDEVLVTRGQFAAQQLLQAFNDFGFALHGGAPDGSNGHRVPHPARQ